LSLIKTPLTVAVEVPVAIFPLVVIVGAEEDDPVQFISGQQSLNTPQAVPDGPVVLNCAKGLAR
jgi:hypothetical protein